MKRVVSAHQIAFFPWVGFFHKMSLCDTFILMDLAQFRARAFMHRNYIEINRDIHWLTWPIDNPKKTQLIKNLRFKPNDNSIDSTQTIFLKNCYQKFKSNYSNAPYLHEALNYIDYLISEATISCSPAELNLKELNYCKSFLEIKTNIIFETSFLPDGLAGTERLLKHALHFESNCYILGSNSRSYCDYSLLLKEGVKVYVQEYSYAHLLEFQSSDHPLAMLHQISRLGWGRLRDLIFKKNITSNQLRNELDSNIIGYKDKFYSSWNDQF